MKDNLPKTALILGHPGHELRVFRFMELYQPIVYILTDGSGIHGGKSRIASTMKILEDAGATQGTVFGRFTDKELYDLILDKNAPLFCTLRDEIEQDIRSQNVELIVGDACEGRNPTHDLCRYMINSIAEKLNLPTLDFLLEGSPQDCPEELKKESLWIELSEEDFERKYQVGEGYEELAFEFHRALELYGKAPFMTECLRPVKDTKNYKNWKSDLPYYESLAVKQVKEGAYQHGISFLNHLLPLAEKICAS